MRSLRDSCFTVGQRHKRGRSIRKMIVLFRAEIVSWERWIVWVYNTRSTCISCGIFTPLSLFSPPSIKFPSSFPIPGQNITLFYLRCFSFNGWTGLPRGDPLSLLVMSSPVYESCYATGQWEWRCLSLYRKGAVVECCTS